MCGQGEKSQPIKDPAFTGIKSLFSEGKAALSRFDVRKLTWKEGVESFQSGNSGILLWAPGRQSWNKAFGNHSLELP